MASYRTADTGLILKDINIGTTTLLCDTSMGDPRPVLTTSGLVKYLTRPTNSHTRVLDRHKSQSRNVLVWHGMKHVIRKWCKECPDCQASKIHRHTRAKLTERLPPSDRICSLQVDLVGSLPQSQDMTYLFTIIDRFRRWPEVVPLPDAYASTCASALLQHWITRFGVPEDITSEADSSHLHCGLWATKFWASKPKTTTAYHPQANGMVERFHRQLKTALKARTTSPNWLEELPMVLLGIRSSWRADLECSPGLSLTIKKLVLSTNRFL